MNFIEGLHKIRFQKLSEEKSITVYKNKKEIDKILKKWVCHLNAIAWETDTGLLATYNRFTGTLIVRYRFKKAQTRQICTYDNYVIFARLVANEDGTYQLRYSFVYERFFRTAYKLLGIFMFSPLLVVFIYRNTFFKYSQLSSLIVCGLFSVMGIVLFIMKEPKLEQCSKVVSLFEAEIFLLL